MCMMKFLIFFTQTKEDLLRTFLARFLHHNGLEASCERTVFSKVLLVFTERCRTDDLHLSARKGGL